MKVYFGRPFTGCDYKEVNDYYDKIKKHAQFDNAFIPVIPFTLTESIKEKGSIKDKIDTSHSPELTDSAIVGRDKWLLSKSDVLVMDFSMQFDMPVGCLYELAWVYDWGKHVIIIMSSANKMNRVFVRECCDVIFETLDQALDYLEDIEI